MRIVLYVILGLILVVAALLIADKVTTDDYRGCAAIFSTDKQEYQSGDTIRLTLTITTEEEKRKISVYDNFDNLQFSSHFTRTCYPDNPEVGDCAFSTMIEEKSISKKKSDYKSYNISVDKPFKQTFFGTIFFDTTSMTYTITFPELGYQGSFKDTEYEISKSYGFIGYLYDINPAPGVSDPFIIVEYKPIRLQLVQRQINKPS